METALVLLWMALSLWRSRTRRWGGERGGGLLVLTRTDGLIWALAVLAALVVGTAFGGAAGARRVRARPFAVDRVRDALFREPDPAVADREERASAQAGAGRCCGLRR
jgi:hypothetical protein